MCCPADCVFLTVCAREGTCSDASSDRRSSRLHPSRGRLGLGRSGRRFHQHRLLLRLPQIHHRVFQRDRGDLQRHQQPGLVDLLHHVGSHVRRRLVVFSRFSVAALSNFSSGFLLHRRNISKQSQLCLCSNSELLSCSDVLLEIFCLRLKLTFTCIV